MDLAYEYLISIAYAYYLAKSKGKQKKTIPSLFQTHKYSLPNLFVKILLENIGKKKKYEQVKELQQNFNF